MTEAKIKRALIGVSDRTGLVDFAQGLVELGVEIVRGGEDAADHVLRHERVALHDRLHQLGRRVEDVLRVVAVHADGAA